MPCRVAWVAESCPQTSTVRDDISLNTYFFELNRLVRQESFLAGNFAALVVSKCA